jgi:aminopeptidase N
MSCKINRLHCSCSSGSAKKEGDYGLGVTSSDDLTRVPSMSQRVRCMFVLIGSLVALASCSKNVPIEEPDAAYPPRKPAKAHALDLGSSVLERGYHVLKYESDVTVDPVGMKLEGHVLLTIQGVRSGIQTLELDAIGLQIKGVTLADTKALPFETTAAKLKITLPKELSESGKIGIWVHYEAGASKGLRFMGDSVLAYGDTPRWLPCVFDPADKAPISMKITVPISFVTVGQGERVGGVDVKGQMKQIQWSESKPFSPTLFGFVTGRLQEMHTEVDNVIVRGYGTELSADQLLALTRMVHPAMRYFSKRSGVPYQGRQLAQIFLGDVPALGVNKLSVMSKDYGRHVLKQRLEQDVMLQGLARQWWGGLVTANRPSDLWLDTALPNYLVATFKQEQWGQDEYDRDVIQAQERVLGSPKNVQKQPLVPLKVVSSFEMNEAYTLSKGMAVLHLLRSRVGEEAFWSTVNQYASNFAYSTASTLDFKTLLEKNAESNLDMFFQQWVFKGNYPTVEVKSSVDGSELVLDILQKQVDPWTFPMRIAIQTMFKRVRTNVIISQRRRQLRFRIQEPVQGIVVNEGNFLPMEIKFKRPLSMLLFQIGQEPDTATRLSAIRDSKALCIHPSSDDEQNCQELVDLLKERKREDRARIVREEARTVWRELTKKEHKSMDEKAVRKEKDRKSNPTKPSN